MAESTHRFCFAPGVRTIQRDEGCVQFGADATRVGIIETAQPDTLASALDKLPRFFFARGFFCRHQTCRVATFSGAQSVR